MPNGMALGAGRRRGVRGRDCDGVRSAPGADHGGVVGTATGEVERARVAPTDRLGVRRFLGRFAGRELRRRWRPRRVGGSWSRSSSPEAVRSSVCGA